MPPANAKRIHIAFIRGGNRKFRALHLDSGNFSWRSESISKKTRIIGVVFRPSNNKLIWTNTLTKAVVVQVDAAPFRQWYEAHYGLSLGKQRRAAKKAEEENKDEGAEETEKSRKVERKLAPHQGHAKVASALES